MNRPYVTTSQAFRERFDEMIQGLDERILSRFPKDLLWAWFTAGGNLAEELLLESYELTRRDD